MLKKVFSLLVLVGFVFSMLIGSQTAFTASATTPTQQTYYVSSTATGSGDGSIGNPFTLTQAQAAVRSINSNMTGNIIIYLRGGSYYLSSTLNFGQADSGTNGYTIEYEAYPGETPILSGGQQVTGWTHDTDSNAPVSGLWKAPLTRSSKLRAIYVNGQRAVMTSKKLPSAGSYGTYSVTSGQASWAWVSGSEPNGVLFSTSNLPSTLRNSQNIEMMTQTTWNTATVCISSIATNGSTNIAYLQQPYGAIAQEIGWAPFSATSSSITVSNVYEWLNTPGQFYFDQANSMLYYYPRSTDNMSTATVIVPNLTKVINVQGACTVQSGQNMTTAGQKILIGQVQNVTFSGLTIEDSDYNLCNVAGSYGEASVQGGTVCKDFAQSNWHNDFYRDYDVLPGAVEINSAINVNITGCTIQNTGAVGIAMENDVTNCTFQGNYIYDTAGTGIEIGNPQNIYMNDSLQPSVYVYSGGGAPASDEKYQNGTESVPKSITVDDNYLLNCCANSALWGGNGIESFYTNSLTITHNEIYNTPYGAISVGWGWWNFDGGLYSGSSCILPNYPAQTSMNNKIDYNRIENSVLTLQDCGGIYTLGNQGGVNGTSHSEIVGNFVNDSVTPVGITGVKTNGIHPDEGSAYINIKNNVLTNVQQHVLELNNWNGKHDDPADTTYSNTSASASGAPNCPVTNFIVNSNYTWDNTGYNIVYNSGLMDQYKGMVQSSIIAPTEFEFAANLSAAGGVAINVGGLLPSTTQVWFAPNNTSTFTAGSTMTEAAGNSKTLITPSAAGTYYIYTVTNGVATKGVHTLTDTGSISNITASTYNSGSGIETETCSEGGLDVCNIQNGSYAVYNSVNLSSNPTTFTARVASDTSGGTIQVRLDSTTGTLLGTCTVPGTGAWQTYTTVTCPLSGASGTHNIYLVYTGGSGYLFNVEWFNFTSSSTTYEAENAALTSPAEVNTNHTGYTGTGFVDGYYDSTTANTTFTVNVATSGSHTVTLRYSAGAGTSTNTGLVVNGTLIKNITCNATTDWNTWATETETVSLNAGSNTISYKAESSTPACINLDNITVS